MHRFLLLASASFIIAACETTVPPYDIETASVTASVETAPMTGKGDKADDPAIWVNTAQPENSLVLGTNKDEGLHVYNLAGEELQFLDVGMINNVDLRGDLAAASNDEFGGISWFRVTEDPSAPVIHLGDTPVERLEPYGFCLGVLDEKVTAGVTFKDGAVELWQDDVPRESGGLNPKLVRTVQLNSQLEGCVFDEENDRLFIGEENSGIWAVDLGDANSIPVSVDTIANQNGLVADVEGVSLWKGENGAGYLVASAQEADRYVVYDRLPPFAPRGVFEIIANDALGIDRVTHTDGLDVISTPLPFYSKGLLVVQDDGNPQSGVDQNFKLVDWSSIMTALELESPD